MSLISISADTVQYLLLFVLSGAARQPAILSPGWKKLLFILLCGIGEGNQVWFVHCVTMPRVMEKERQAWVTEKAAHIMSSPSEFSQRKQLTHLWSLGSFFLYSLPLQCQTAFYCSWIFICYRSQSRSRTHLPAWASLAELLPLASEDLVPFFQHIGQFAPCTCVGIA